MKIEMLESVKHDGGEYLQGDQRNVSDEVGAYFCGNGWAKDVDGKVATAERDVNRKVLAPANVFHGHKAGEV